MDPTKFLRLTLLLATVFMITFSKKNKKDEVNLSKKDISFFKKNLPKWGAPAVVSVMSGDVKEKNGATILTIEYEAKDQICDGVYKKPRKGLAENGWSCKTAITPDQGNESDSVEDKDEEEEHISNEDY